MYNYSWKTHLFNVHCMLLPQPNCGFTLNKKIPITQAAYFMKMSYHTQLQETKKWY